MGDAHGQMLLQQLEVEGKMSHGVAFTFVIMLVLVKLLYFE